MSRKTGLLVLDMEYQILINLQMTEAGWKYTPTPESDDMVQCNYCALTIDKWGKNDIPS